MYTTQKYISIQYTSAAFQVTLGCRFTASCFQIIGILDFWDRSDDAHLHDRPWLQAEVPCNASPPTSPSEGPNSWQRRQHWPLWPHNPPPKRTLLDDQSPPPPTSLPSHDMPSHTPSHQQTRRLCATTVAAAGGLRAAAPAEPSRSGLAGSHLTDSLAVQREKTATGNALRNRFFEIHTVQCSTSHPINTHKQPN